MNLEDYVKFHSPGYVIEIYNKGKEEEIVFGNREVKPNRIPCTSTTLYDIASLTKTYTAVLVYKAYEEKKLNLNDFISSLDSSFSNLSDVTILDLLGHRVEIWTDGYLGTAKSKEEFYKILYSAKVKERFPTYVDTHYIILSTLLEKIYEKDFDFLLQEKIFKPLHLKCTTTNPTGENIASNNFETLNDKVVDFITPGLVHDTKARKAKEFGITTGHASIFTTGKELLLFLKSFLENTLLSKETISLMLEHENRNQMNLDKLKEVVPLSDINTMHKLAKENDSAIKIMRTYNHMGARYRNLIKDLNDIPTKCSENTITFSGFTGPSYVIDFDANIIVMVMCNVMHTTKLTRSERKNTTDEIIEKICDKLY